MHYDDTPTLRRDAAVVQRDGFVPQRQDSLTDQLADLCVLARRFGLYDADDWVQRKIARALES